MSKLYSWVFLFGFLFPSFSWAWVDHPWSFGIYSGYSVIGALNSVSIDNGFPVGLDVQYQWTNRWRTDAKYQWINSEHEGHKSANIQSFQFIPSYEFFTHDGQHLDFESGLGYQYEALDEVDTIRQMEWLVGPAWTWTFLEPWNLNLKTFYIKSFDHFLESSQQRFDIQFGISFQFGSASRMEEKPFSDADQDGVNDDIDECSGTAYGMSVAKNGCPLDGDGDLVPDYNDFCPDTKRGIEVDEMGCPLSAPGRGVVDGVAFEPNSPRLLDPSKIELAKLADQLKKFPELFYVVEGYSSSETTSAERLITSKARAVTVMNVLISFGIPAYKMKAVGLSDLYPLTDSKNPNDQILNERIEIKWKPNL
jgi:flagellar motor protein MotB